MLFNNYSNNLDKKAILCYTWTSPCQLFQEVLRMFRTDGALCDDHTFCPSFGCVDHPCNNCRKTDCILQPATRCTVCDEGDCELRKAPLAMPTPAADTPSWSDGRRRPCSDRAGPRPDPRVRHFTVLIKGDGQHKYFITSDWVFFYKKNYLYLVR